MANNTENFRDSLDAMRYKGFYSQVETSSKKLRLLAAEAADAFSQFKNKPPELATLINALREIQTAPVQSIPEILDKISEFYANLMLEMTKKESLILEQADWPIVMEKQNEFNEEMVVLLTRIVAIHEASQDKGVGK